MAKIQKHRTIFLRNKSKKSKDNLYYINRRRKARDFSAGDVVMYKFLHLQKGSSTQKVLYHPAVITYIYPSNTHCDIQSLVTDRKLKYSFTYLKPFKELSSSMKYTLPTSWQQKIKEKLSMNGENQIESNHSSEMDSNPDFFSQNSEMYMTQNSEMDLIPQDESSEIDFSPSQSSQNDSLGLKNLFGADTNPTYDD